MMKSTRSLKTRAKTYDLSFKGFGVYPSKCRVHILRKADKAYVFLEDLRIGTSVTNAVETIAKEIYLKWLKGIDLTKITWFQQDSIEELWEVSFQDMCKAPLELSKPQFRPLKKSDRRLLQFFQGHKKAVKI